jgi:hypothetical protein
MSIYVVPNNHNRSTKPYSPHKRLKHINFQLVHELVKSSLILGLSCLFHVNITCEIYQLGKQACYKKFPRSTSITIKPLQLVHNDVCSPFKHPIHNGAHYFVTFLNDYSKHILMVLIKTKNQVFEEFKIFFLKSKLS